MTSIGTTIGLIKKLANGGKPSQNYAFTENPDTGALELHREGVEKPVATLAPNGSTFADHVQTGAGSFHLSKIHSLSSAGKEFCIKSGSCSDRRRFIPSKQDSQSK